MTSDLRALLVARVLDSDQAAVHLSQGKTGALGRVLSVAGIGRAATSADDLGAEKSAENSELEKYPSQWVKKQGSIEVETHKAHVLHFGSRYLVSLRLCNGGTKKSSFGPANNVYLYLFRIQMFVSAILGRANSLHWSIKLSPDLAHEWDSSVNII